MSLVHAVPFLSEALQALVTRCCRAASSERLEQLGELVVGHAEHRSGRRPPCAASAAGARTRVPELRLAVDARGGGPGGGRLGHASPRAPAGGARAVQRRSPCSGRSGAASRAGCRRAAAAGTPAARRSRSPGSSRPRRPGPAVATQKRYTSVRCARRSTAWKGGSFTSDRTLAGRRLREIALRSG